MHTAAEPFKSTILVNTYDARATNQTTNETARSE
jgi:hypothetical protein